MQFPTQQAVWIPVSARNKVQAAALSTTLSVVQLQKEPGDSKNELTQVAPLAKRVSRQVCSLRKIAKLHDPSPPYES